MDAVQKSALSASESILLVFIIADAYVIVFSASHKNVRVINQGSKHFTGFILHGVSSHRWRCPKLPKAEGIEKYPFEIHHINSVMSLVFYCLPRPGHPTFDTQYFQANPLETPEWFDDSISTEAYYEALGPIPKEATVNITLHPDSEVNQLKDLLKLYLELISTYPSTPTYEWIRKIERHTENSEKAEKPVLSIAEVVGTILQWEIAYGTFYMRFMPALNKLIASLEDSDNTKCLQEDEEAQSKHIERLRTSKKAGCTCQCFAHPPAGPASPALSSKEIQALGKLYFAMHLEQAVEEFYGEFLA